MKQILTLLLLTISLNVSAAAYIKLGDIKGESQAIEEADKGWTELVKKYPRQQTRAPERKATGESLEEINLHFPESLSGYVLTEKNELLHVQKGKIVKRIPEKLRHKQRAVNDEKPEEKKREKPETRPTDRSQDRQR
ncbi:hypothetical protein QP938_08080 [Porticoccaceae bacterium LTM1]|nr:hypothetical protein QP938_08080 [Porticoccaceae bacterium LTM1]